MPTMTTPKRSQIEQFASKRTEIYKWRKVQLPALTLQRIDAEADRRGISVPQLIEEILVEFGKKCPRV